MKFKLDFKENLSKSLLFWISRYIKFKLSSLSNKELKNPKILSSINYKLTCPINHIDELDGLVKMARNAGLTGINTYFNPLKKLFESLEFYELESLKQIDEELISEILASITAGLSDASKKNFRVAIINFFSFLDKQNEDNGNSYVFGIELKNWGGVSGSRGVKLPEYMNEDEIFKFLKAIDETDFKSNKNRNVLMLKIIIYTGIRVGEALNLRQKDLNKQDDLFIVRIRGKGNKYRIVMIKRELIEENLNNMQINFANKEGYLFVNSKGNKLTQAYVSRQVSQVLFKAGIRKEKNGAHMLRHSFATLLYKKQKDLILVQEALGHASLDTSKIYTHFDSERLKLAANLVSDMASKKN